VLAAGLSRRLPAGWAEAHCSEFPHRSIADKASRTAPKRRGYLIDMPPGCVAVMIQTSLGEQPFEIPIPLPSSGWKAVVHRNALGAGLARVLARDRPDHAIQMEPPT
jgi:hypothetical protein